ncbi:MAG TPA: IS200/IS605 family transposase [Fervidobacterium sp.]|uniref:IS200/IS605 family transposase n=1 Tax=Coprothermobacter proteolyticus TaxID=35786 RepID=UPI000D303BBD|nr:IS200/IS605 family transposase [Coprothermobacter proteolyticus]MBK6586026.1 IS200/IS605 family transposase [Coprothermobacter sp.]HUM44699.1 IS200/IS605 family transposase [Fervidobacterium sp.]HOK24377.1 IS200/IS605 family transposase [Coprothermobacter proteolyticus]HOL53086.1 IS200/IS605 family transposase [Coprothermobacter proteolyticus]HOP45670.1 IS200/IS605 family transposase [Coprothermobacter proteolyticus]
MQLRKTRWSLYNLNYHFVWIPKYRRRVLVEDVTEELEKLIFEIGKKHEIEVLSLSVQPDHIHLFVSAPPRLSPAQIANLFKGVSSKKLMEKFPYLRTKEGLWSRTYYVGSAGTVSEETIRRYIEECQDM